MKRDKTGKFTRSCEGEAKKTVSLSLTSTAWQLLEEQAAKFSVSRSELIEQYARSLAFSATEDNTTAQEECCPKNEDEAWFRQVIDSIPHMVWICNLAGEVEYYNQQTLTLFGITMDEVLLGGWQPLIHPEDVAQVIEKWTASVTTGKPYEIEFRMKMTNGDYRWHLNRALLLRDRHGKPLRWIGTATDIDERKRLEQELKNHINIQQYQSKWLEAVLNALPIPLLLIDSEVEEVTFSNRAANQMAGINLSDVTSLHHEVYHCTDLQGEWIPPQELPFARAARGEKIQGFELNWHNPAGVYPLLVYADTLPSLYEHPATSVVVFQDIRERKQMELQLQQSEHFIQQVADATPGILYIYDLVEQRNIYVNRQIGEILGYTPKEIQAMGNQLFPRLMHPEELATLGAHVKQFYTAADNEVIEREYRLQHANGEWCWFWSRDIIFSRTPEGLPQQIVGISHDITKRKRIEMQLRETEERLQLALSSAKAIAWDNDIINNHTVCSENAIEIWGKTEGTLEDFLKGIHPQERSKVIQAWHKAQTEDQHYTQEFRVFDSKGVVRWLRSKGQVYFDSQGNPVRIVGISLDISDRKYAEYALQLSQRRYRSLAESLPQLICMSRSYDVLDYCNPSWTEYTGLTAEETQRQGWQSVVHPKDLPLARRQWKKALIRKNSYTLEVRLRRKDGGYCWHLVKVVPIPGEDSFAESWLATATDIDSQKQTEQRERFLAQASHTFAEASLDLQTILDTITRLVSEFTGDLCILQLLSEDKQWLRSASLHYSNGEAIELLSRLLKQAPRTPDEGLSGQVIQSGEALLSEFQPEQLQALIPHPYHTYLERFPVCSVLIVPLKIQGECIGTLSLARHTPAEPHTSEEQSLLQDLADRAAMAIANAKLYQQAQKARQRAEKTADRTARLQAVTAALSEPLTPAQVAEVIAQQTTSVSQGSSVLVATVTPDEKDLEIIHYLSNSETLDSAWRRFPLSLASPLTDAIRSKEPMWEEPLEDRIARYPHLAESYRKLDYSAWISLPLVVQSQAIGGMSITFKEFPRLSEEDRAFLMALAQQCGQAIARAQLYEAEQQARASAEAANRTKDEFLAVLSHELRTPMNPILGWTTLLRRGRLAPEKREIALETIERNAKLQVQLIEDLLDISRILQGKLSLRPNPINLVSTIQAAIETIRLAAEAKSIQLSVQLASNLGHILGDSARLQQVIWNLLSNAVKFTPKGGQVTITLDQVNSIARIQVKDTGRGIDPEFLPYVFEYFRQADSSTTRTFGGLGLGLAIASHIIDLHGGTIQAESLGMGKGATFTLQLPLMPTQSSVTTPKSSTPPEQLMLQQMKVLIVDDEIDNLELISFILEEAGANVFSASSAPEALEILQQNCPDILVTDIGMPKVDGYELLEKAKAIVAQQGKRIPAIALTAYAAESDRQRVLEAGFEMHLPKPIEPKALIQAISQFQNRN